MIRTTLAGQLSDPVLIRLLRDDRMRKKVWEQLSRKNRRDGSFLHPTLLSADVIAVAAERQDLAMFLLLRLAYEFTRRGPAVLRRRDVERIRSETRTLAGKLREAVWAVSTINVAPREHAQNVAKLYAAAAVLDRAAVEGGSGEVVIERDRGASSKARALAMSLTDTCVWLFGAPLPSVTATLTSVALNHEVAADQVRDWRKAWNARASK